MVVELAKMLVLVIVGSGEKVIVVNLRVEEVAVSELRLDLEIVPTMDVGKGWLVVGGCELDFLVCKLELFSTDVMGATVVEVVGETATTDVFLVEDEAVAEAGIEGFGVVVDGAGLMIEYECGQDLEQTVVIGFPVTVTVVASSVSSVTVENTTRVVGGITMVLMFVDGITMVSVFSKVLITVT